MSAGGIRRLALSLLVMTVGMAGCAGIEPVPNGAGVARNAAGQPLSPNDARALVEPRISTKGEVLAALGPALVIAFDSGHEVWVYRWPGSDRHVQSATELVLLFNPAGLAIRARIRPGT